MTTHEPVLLYDGDCGFCTRCVWFVVDRLPVRTTVRAWQDADLATMGVSVARARRAVLWVGPRGDVHSGAAAVGELLRHTRGRGWHALGFLLRAPVVRDVAELGYRLVAANRHRLPGATPACQLPRGERPGE
ncbi:DUF393 domain-containing protein [Spiractinospora alimapuensis]|uniref:thiol-disulfide oxidoreductase DCC family protein n=1 Tax=Spiractinospora alimapuensis TaxID=2820884 RepID=UPI001F36D6C1|nr:DUF393 domain-containing protein [Spiractinospora alimapuensis]QVQ49988.1 DUF393 domain-containing protein [Spiractinospora alimapuensis]